MTTRTTRRRFGPPWRPAVERSLTAVDLSSSSSLTSTPARVTSRPSSGRRSLQPTSYAAREDPIPGVTGALVADAVRAVRPQTEVKFVPGPADLVPTVIGAVRPGDLVITIGAGDITGVGPALLERLALPDERGGRVADPTVEAI